MAADILFAALQKRIRRETPGKPPGSSYTRDLELKLMFKE